MSGHLPRRLGLGWGDVIGILLEHKGLDLDCVGLGYLLYKWREEPVTDEQKDAWLKSHRVWSDGNFL